MAERVSPDNWTPGAWSYPTLVDMTSRLDPGRIDGFGAAWLRLLDDARAVLLELDRHVGAVIDQSWQGRGAAAAGDALRHYIAESLAGLLAGRSVAERLAELSGAAADLRAAIVPLVGTDDTDRQLDEALEQVRRRYSQPAVAAGNAVEDFPAPPAPFGVAPGVSAATLPSAASGAPPNVAAGSPTTAPQGFTAASPTATPPALRDGAIGHLTPAPAHPVAPPPTVRELSPAPAQQVLTEAGPVAAATNPVAAPHPGVASRSAVPMGAPFLGAAYPGLLGRDGGTEHRCPTYLVSAGNTSELIGELPLVAPPVIGE